MTVSNWERTFQDGNASGKVADWVAAKLEEDIPNLSLEIAAAVREETRLIVADDFGNHTASQLRLIASVVRELPGSASRLEAFAEAIGAQFARRGASASSVINAAEVADERVLEWLSTVTEALGVVDLETLGQFREAILLAHRSCLESYVRAKDKIMNEKVSRVESERRRERSTLLEIAEAFSSGLSSQDVAEKLAHYVVASTGGDGCRVLALDADQQVAKPLAALGLDDSDLAGYLENPMDVAQAPLTRSIVENSRPRLASGRQRVGLPDCEAEALRLQGRGELLGVPLLLADKVVGVMYLEDSQGDYEFTEVDALRAEELGALAAIALENARLYEGQREMLRTLQRALLPGSVPKIPGLGLGVFYGSATVGAELGGDFYDFIDLPDGRMALVLGDVCGKGIQASSHMAMARFILRGFALTHPSPASVLHRLNNALQREMRSGSFITLFYAVYDMNEHDFVYSFGGHPRPYHYHASRGRVRLLKGRGTALGLFPRLHYQERTVAFEPGDVLVMFTDGLSDARKERNFFGDGRLRDLVEEWHHLPAQHLAEQLYRECLNYCDGQLMDDIAILVLKREPQT